MRTGTYGHGAEIKVQTVNKALAAITTTCKLAAEQSPALKGEEEYITPLRLHLEGFRRTDAPAIPQLAVPVSLIHHIHKTSTSSSSPLTAATADLSIIAFYYLLRVGEYTQPRKVKVNGTWHLAKFDLSNESVVTLAAGVTTINSDCKSSKYYVTRDGVKNIFAININDGNVFNEPLVDDVSFSDRKEWSVYNDVLYYVYDGVVYSQPFHTKEVRKLSSTKDNVTQIELNNGRLLFIVKTLDDSHISELSP